MELLTLIVVPEETQRVRRFRIRVDRLKQVGVVCVGLALIGLVGGVDWVRLRIDAVDVDEMRQQTARDHEALDALGSEVAELEASLERLHEFERKVRVIANLPGAEERRSGGQGGSDAVGEPEAPEPAEAGASGLDAGPSPVGGSESGLSAGSEEPGDQAAWKTLGRRARDLARASALQQERFTDLLEGLEGQANRLAATPSIKPLDGWVTSTYGYRTSPFTGQRQFHSGLDIAAQFGTPIFAPARGRVDFVGKKGPLGKTLIIDHGHGIKTHYGHNAEIFVRRGEIVERGTRVAAVGSTGRSTGPHLHYAVQIRGRSVNPRDYIID